MSTYMFSYRLNKGNTGGSGGVNYKLMMANNAYNEVKDLTFFFKENSSEKAEKSYNIKDRFSFLRRIGVFNVFIKERQLKRAIKWIKSFSEQYSFSEKDMYIFHDFEAAYAFVKLYPNYKNTVLVYHQQGSLYDEWSASLGISSKYYKTYLDTRLSYVISKINVIGFPSYGSRNILLNSGGKTAESLKNKEYVVLYNGVDVAIKDEITENIKKYVDKLQSCSGPKLISVSNLNFAKGVEKIPLYLKPLKEVFPDFIWFIIGRGIKSDELKKNIREYGINDNVIWIDYPLTNNEVLSIMKETDYYVMLHRWSIFDLATLEAMGSGNIPILSNVGGNPEVILNENGCLINEADEDSILKYIMDTFQQKESLKELNREIQKEYFSVYKMLKNYSNLIIQ